MEVASGEGEDDDGDPSMALPGAKLHLSCRCPWDLFSVSIISSSAVSLQDGPASSKHFGHHLNQVEDILRNHQEVGQHGDCDEGIGGVSLLLDTFWISFTDRQLLFRASFQPYGQLGRQVADHHDGDLGRQGEAVPDQGTDSMVEDKVWGVWVWVEVPVWASISLLVWVSVGLGQGVNEVCECDNR